MASISAPGLGSGLDIGSIVDELVALESLPLQQLEADERELEADLSAYGQLNSSLSSFQSAMESLGSLSKFKTFTSTSSNEAAFTASATSDAAPGSYNIEVTSLAANHKLSSSAFADSSTVVGTGTLTISVGAESFDVAIDNTKETLAGIRTAINEASDNTGVTATIVNADGGSYLVLTSDETGTANEISVTVSGDGDGNDSDNAGLSQLVYVSGVTENMSEVQAATDATLTVDNTFNITSSSNTITGAIEGLTIEVDAIGTGTLALDRDDTTIEDNIQQFVDAFNDLNKTIDNLRAGQLEADNTLLTVETLIQNVFNAPADIAGGAFSYLSEIGITTNDQGELTLDTTMLQTALDTDFDGVAQLFANEPEGFAYRLEAIADDLLDDNGIIDAREDGINAELEDIEERKLDLERRLELTEQRLLAEFTALDVLLAELNNTSAFLTQQLANLPTISVGSS